MGFLYLQASTEAVEMICIAVKVIGERWVVQGVGCPVASFWRSVGVCWSGHNGWLGLPHSYICAIAKCLDGIAWVMQK